MSGENSGSSTFGVISHTSEQELETLNLQHLNTLKKENLIFIIFCLGTIFVGSIGYLFIKIKLLKNENHKNNYFKLKFKNIRILIGIGIILGLLILICLINFFLKQNVNEFNGGFDIILGSNIIFLIFSLVSIFYQYDFFKLKYCQKNTILTQNEIENFDKAISKREIFLVLVNYFFYFVIFFIFNQIIFGLMNKTISPNFYFDEFGYKMGIAKQVFCVGIFMIISLILINGLLNVFRRKNFENLELGFSKNIIKINLLNIFSIWLIMIFWNIFFIFSTKNF